MAPSGELISKRLAGVSGPVVVAVSGGADSAAAALVAVAAGLDVRAVHVDHGLPASPMLRDAAEAVAEHVGLALSVLVVSPRTASEADLRSARYDALLGDLRPGESLMTAHTRDDRVETVLINMMRGTGPEGLAGIPARRGPIIRPFLDLDRATLRAVADAEGLPYLDDPENDSAAHLRNRVRHEVIPLLVSIEPAAGAAIDRLADNLAEHIGLLEIDSVTAERSDLGVRVPVGPMSAIGSAARRQLIRRLVSVVRGPMSPTRAEVDRIDEVLRSGSATDLQGTDATVRVVGPWLVIGHDAPAAPAPAELESGLEWGDFRFRTRPADRLPRLSKWSFRHDDVPMIVRAARSTDTIAMRSGSKSAVEAIREGGFDPARHPVVVAGDEIVWIPGARHGWSGTRASGYLVTVADEDSRWAPFEP